MITDALRTCVLTLIFVSQIHKASSAACMNVLEPKVFENITASSETTADKASDVFTKGWCASERNGSSWLDVYFTIPTGISSIEVGAPEDLVSYPARVLVQYVPNAAHNDSLQDNPGKQLLLQLSHIGSTSAYLIPSTAVKRLRFWLQEYVVKPCMKIKVSGCSIEELCPNICQNEEVCVAANTCICPQDFYGDVCDKRVCKHTPLGIADGHIPPNNVSVSSEDSVYNKTEIGNAQEKKGWCPSQSDLSPWVIIKLEKPIAISVLEFGYINRQENISNMYMHTFELQYIAPVDSTRRFITFATNLPAMNGTSYFAVSIEPPLVTDTIRILPILSEGRPCFKLELQGCDPKSLCSTDWCKNGGTCIGQNVCLCSNGTYGDRCEQKKTEISNTSLAFENITNNTITTASSSLQFYVNGNVQLNTSVVIIAGQNSFIKLSNGARNATCISDIDQCNNGFTFSIDIKFELLQDNTYIITSGGDRTNHRGIALFYTTNKLTYIVSTSTQMWTLEVKYQPVLHVWQHIEITWNRYYGVELFIDGHSLGSSGQPVSKQGTEVLELCIACSPMNVTVSVHIKDILSWFIDRTVLVNAGIKQEPKTTSSAAGSTLVTTLKTTTELPIPTLKLNLTNVHNNTVVIGTEYNLTVYGTIFIKDGGISINSSSQYIEFVQGQLTCLQDPTQCSYGLTIQITMHVYLLEENTFFLTSGGQIPNGIGIAIIYRFGKMQIILSTNTASWYATCTRNDVLIQKYLSLTISWSITTGLEVFIDNVLIDSSNSSTPHSPEVHNTTGIYIGKQPSEMIKVEFVLQEITIWYVHIDILVERGICQPPVRPITATPRPVSSTARTMMTFQTSSQTVSTVLSNTTNQQCPAGCISVGATTVSSSMSSMISSVKSNGTFSTHAQPKPTDSASLTTVATTTRVTSTSKPISSTTTPTTSRTSSAPPITTRSAVPDYQQTPTIIVTIENDNNAYLMCSFPVTSQAGVQITGSLIVEEKEVLVKVVPGNVGVVMFAVAEVNMFLYLKKIQCSIKASFVGTYIYTQIYFSSVFVPKFQVFPGIVTVIEGHQAEFVTVTSTAPPQLYCCDGCKAQCQVFVVGSFQYDRTFQKCNSTYIAQAIIGSSIPQNYNRPICGFALTAVNWNQANKIEVKATLDGRKDGDQKLTLDIIAHVYNQPTTAQISVKPSSYNILSVQVMVKDYDNPATCSSVNDPHITTFDGQRYDNMREGQFILYRHKILPFEVRALYHKCSARSSVACNCGVAVKSGDDIITVTGCQGYTSGGHPGQGHGFSLIMQQLFGSSGHSNNNQELAKTPMTVQIYKNGEFTPGTHIRRYGCGQKYEIELPTGMIVTVQQSFLPFINIWLVASSIDREQAEGLCGNFDGSRTNDLTPNTNSFIANWIVSGDNFFYGVGTSSLMITSTYCSCIQGKESVCSAGLGVIQCTSSVNDITATLVRQAKLPVLSRRKRQLHPGSDLPATNISPDNNTLTLEEARDQCGMHIMNSTMTNSCQPILTTNLTEQIENCASDYNATGSFEWALDALRDIAMDCVNTANAMLAANATGDNNTAGNLPEVPHDLQNILANACVEKCGNNGECRDGVCSCMPGFSGVTCNISTATKPTVSAVPLLCDTVQTDCLAATIIGENFVQSQNLKCHFEFIEIAEGISTTGSKGSEHALYISINQVTCLLPRLQSARLTVSNDGQTESDEASIHVVFSSVCHECSLTNDTVFTPACIRKENTCIIDEVCYNNGQTKQGDTCKMCQPATNYSSWSSRNVPECVATNTGITQTQSEDSQKASVIALAVVCAVLAAILVIVGACLVKSRSHGKKKKNISDHNEKTYDNMYSEAQNPTYMENPQINCESNVLGHF